MDAILLQPGNPELFAGTLPDGDERGLESPWREWGIDPARCIELVSMHQGTRKGVHDPDHTLRPTATHFTCVKYVDPTSVRLYALSLVETPLGHGRDEPTRLHIVRDRTRILTISMIDATVHDLKLQSHLDDRPTEQFELRFTAVEWDYVLNRPAQ